MLILYLTLLNILITGIVGAALAWVGDAGSSIADSARSSELAYSSS
jgi:hypothetical protein